MENLFSNFVQKKGKGFGKGRGKNKRAINTASLYDFSLKCDDIKRGCDWMTFVSMECNSLKVICPCFSSIVNNTNSNQLIIPGDEIENCPFESVSVIRNVPKPKQEYFDVFVVYEGETYHIMQFGFYGDARAGQNKIMADFKIYGQCWRLQSICNNRFLIAGFVPSLLSWGVIPTNQDLKEKLEIALDDGNEEDIERCMEELFVGSFNSEDDPNLDVITAFRTYYLTRFDFRIDFFHPDRNLIDIPKYKDLRITKRKHGDTPFENFQPSRDVPKGYLNHDYTGYTIGKRSNKYTYLRFYHKQVDIFRTGEKTLYYDYIKYSGSVWRLEFEFGSRFTTASGKYDFLQVMSGVFEKKIFEYLGINEKTSCFSRFYELGGVPFNEKSQFQKQITIGQYASIGDKFRKAGINPFTALACSLQKKKGYTSDEIDKFIYEILEDKTRFDDTYKAFGLDIDDNNDII